MAVSIYKYTQEKHGLSYYYYVDNLPKLDNIDSHTDLNNARQLPLDSNKLFECKYYTIGDF